MDKHIQYQKELQYYKPANSQGFGQGQGAAGAGLLVLRRADPDVVTDRPGDPLEGHEALGVDTIVVGQENSHGVRRSRQCG